MKQVLLFALALCFAQMTFAQNVDNESSSVSFEVSNMGKTVKGTMSNLEGTVNFAANSLETSNFEVTVDPSTVQTKSKGRDKHLQKFDFFDVKIFPTIKVSSDKITKTETGYEATAILTIKEVSTPITIPFTVEEDGGKQHFNGTFMIERKKYDLGEEMGAGSIGLEVKVEINCTVDAE